MKESEKVLEAACDLIVDITGSCPADAYNVEPNEESCEKVCFVGCESVCWKNYLKKKVRGAS